MIEEMDEEGFAFFGCEFAADVCMVVLVDGMQVLRCRSGRLYFHSLVPEGIAYPAEEQQQP